MRPGAPVAASAQPAFLLRDGALSYADLLAEVAGLVPLLAEREAWLLLARSRRRLAVGALACVVAGRAFVLPPSFAPDAVAALLPGHGVLHDGDAVGLDLRRAPTGPAADLLLPTDGRPIARLHTSGSTGEPRQVDKAAHQLIGEALALVGAFGMQPQDRVVTSVPTHHIYGLLFGVLAPLLAGASIDDSTPLLPDEVAARVRATGATTLVSVPAHLRALADAAPAGLAPLRRVFSSGAPLQPATADRWRTLGLAPITEVFGSTETGGIAWRHQLDDARWRPLPGVVVEAEGDRLRLRSPFAASPDPLLCDDRVALHDDGAFSHLGRLDDVVKVASRRVSIGALERTILAVPGVREAAVIAVPDEARGVALRGLVAGDAALADVRAALLQAFDPVVLPRLIVVNALPRDPSGKLPRARLLAMVAPPPRERVLAFAVDGDRATATLEIPADHVATRGHFPDRPIVPGAALLGQLIAPLLARAGFPARITGVEVATFHRPVLPGDTVEVALTREGDRVRFRLGRGDEALASGSLRVS